MKDQIEKATTMKDHINSARSAILSLRIAAGRGDAEAAKGLVEVGVYAGRLINTLATYPEEFPGRAALDSVASESEWWPVVVGAMEELRPFVERKKTKVSKNRPFCIPESLGTNLLVRLEGQRTLHYDSNTGFTLSIMHEMREHTRFGSTAFMVDALRECDCLEDSPLWLRAGHVPPSLLKENVPQWVDAAMAHLEINCAGSFENFPWPNGIKSAAEKRLKDGNNKPLEKAFRYVITKRLTDGFKALAKRTC